MACFGARFDIWHRRKSAEADFSNIASNFY